MPAAASGWSSAVCCCCAFRFSIKPVQGDDDIYLTEAAHAQIEPLHPANVTYVFRGDAVDLRGHSHPPLNAWPLALLVAAFGERERDSVSRRVHRVLADCGLVDVVAGADDSRRIPLWATLLFWPSPHS